MHKNDKLPERTILLTIAFLLGLSCFCAAKQLHSVAGTASPHNGGTPWAAPGAKSLFPIPSFQMTDYASGSGPLGLATGDFRGNGYLDVVTANFGNSYNGNTVSVLLNNGDGTFQTHVDYTVGSLPDHVAVGDFNGDGKLDIVVSNYKDGTISVLLGNGDGTFQPQITTALGLPDDGALAVGDFNHDGKLDLAMTDRYRVALRVFFGNGDGTFSAPTSYPLPWGEVVTVKTAHLRSATNLDLIAVVCDDSVADCDAGQAGYVAVLLGRRNGTFQPAKTYPVAIYPNDVVVADFNGDGKLDLAVVNHCGLNNTVAEDCAGNVGAISILAGNGDGTFRKHVDYTLYYPSSQQYGLKPWGIVAKDFNGDGILDLATLTWLYDAGTATWSEAVTVLIGKGNGTFTVQEPYAIGQNVASTLLSGQFANGGSGSNDIILNNAPNTSQNIGDMVVMLNQGGTQIALTSSANPSQRGAAITLSATVSASVQGAGTPTGKVNFYREVGSTDRFLVGTASLVNGVASFNYSKLPKGKNQLGAQYAGDGSFNPTYNSQALTQTVQ